MRLTRLTRLVLGFNVLAIGLAVNDIQPEVEYFGFLVTGSTASAVQWIGLGILSTAILGMLLRLRSAMILYVAHCGVTLLSMAVSLVVERDRSLPGVFSLLIGGGAVFACVWIVLSRRGEFSRNVCP